MRNDLRDPPNRPDIDEPWLLLVFRPQLEFAFLAGDAGERFTADDTTYHAKVGGDIVAFYDRLYDADGRFIGLRVSPQLAEEYLPDVLGRLPYVQTDPNERAFHVFLFGTAPSDLCEVRDHAFSGRFYESVRGEFALSFDTFFLSADERTALEGIAGIELVIRPSNE